MPAIEQFYRADVVFKGTVSQVSTHYIAYYAWYMKGLIGANSNEPPEWQIEFAVDEPLKGSIGKTVVVCGDLPSGGNCALDFQEGSTWVVFASQQSDGRLLTNGCMGTDSIAYWQPQMNDLMAWSRECKQ
jgi:hypothetical protein